MACDVAIVGAGITGAATAYWLAELAPKLRIVLVEAHDIAHGASGRNAGFLLQGTATNYALDVATYGRARARKLLQFTRGNRDLIVEKLRGRMFHLEKSGSLVVAGSPEEDRQLQESVSLMRADGVPVAYIPPEDTNERIMSQGFLGALYVPSNGMLNPLSLVRHLVVESGARLLTHHPVERVVQSGQSTLVYTPSQRIRTKRVVLTMNAYLPQLFPELSTYVRPVRAQMLATAPMPQRWLKLPIYSHEGYYYVRQLASGEVLVGGARHLHEQAEVGYGDHTTPGLQQDLLAYLHAYFPQTRDLGILHRWSGVMGFSPDHLPVIGRVPGTPNGIWAAGFTGHGMGYGVRFGKLLAECVLEKRKPEGYDLFSEERFTKKPPRKKRRPIPHVKSK